ncbi:MucR family transcriptional regulator [Flavisphingomonas formosensis]|uniref:MucR family transcriptional regulator n=1 Tax=Flavisphingomonas formosensis TaxID=861534 RepID=UPI0012FA742D|nr:MucR family transcriptional regulator [Sphingomonas formosensis]
MDETLLTLTVDIVSAHVSKNSVATTDLPALISSVHASLSALGKPAEPEPEVLAPAVSVRSSVKPDYIVCLEDGKKLKMLKRHLMTHYQMTPDQYRAKWKLPADYPMVAPNYADQRKALAIKIGLGRKPKASEPAPAPAKAARKPRTKKTASDAKAAAAAHLSGN